MSILDNQAQQEKLDPGQVGQAIIQLPDQLTQVINDFQKISTCLLNTPVNKVVVNGMGGSNLGARLIASTLSEQLTVPIIVEPGYTVPGYVDSQTLYLVSSYSGSTEEPLSTIEQAQQQGAQLAIITADRTNNHLAQLARQYHWPAYLFTEQHNPSGQPRLGLGYAIFGLLGLLNRLKLISFDLNRAQSLVNNLKIINQNWQPNQPTNKNLAKQLAQQLVDQQIWLVGPDHLAGNLHILRNQINETGKHLASYLTVPELNHYAMEGLSFPTNIPKTLTVLSFKTTALHPRLAKRLALTDQIFQENKLPIINYSVQSPEKLGQALEVLAFGSWLSYYLGILHGIDPIKIPWVDLFKQQLS